jgi:hypothetical protein
MMGRTPTTCFPKTNSHVVTNMCDTDGGTQPQAMCLHISKQKSKPLHYYQSEVQFTSLNHCGTLKVK